MIVVSIEFFKNILGNTLLLTLELTVVIPMFILCLIGQGLFEANAICNIVDNAEVTLLEQCTMFVIVY